MFNKKPVVFIAKDTTIVLTQKSDIILSPEFYWVIKKKLNIKHAWQVKKICPSLFDGMLSEGNYEYLVVKRDDAFLLFAYDSNYILEHLKKLGINTDFIGNIYFAQNEFLKENVYTIGNKVLVAENDIFMILPKTLVPDQGLDIEQIIFERLSKIKISVDKYNLFIDKKSFNLIVITLMLYISCTVIESFLYKNSLNKIQTLQAELYQKHNLPTTSWQVDSIKKKSFAKHTEQMILRQNIYKIFETPLDKDDFFTNIYFEKKDVIVALHLKEIKKADEIKAKLAQSFKVNSAKVQNNNFTVELISE